MSWRPPGERRFTDGEFVRTPKKQAGRIVGHFVGRSPQHNEGWWDDRTNRWETSGDEYGDNIYHVELLDQWDEPYTEPWPEDLLEPATLLDALAR
jgi:hypothetical protein